MRRAATIAALGAGLHDGEEALLTYATTETRLRWNEAAAKWRGASAATITARGDWKLTDSGAVPNSWNYLSRPIGNPGQIGQSSYTWSPHSIRDADAAYAAGLHLQEELAAVWWNFDAGARADLGLIRYAVGDGDMISTVSVPAGNVACLLTSSDGVRKWQTTGWVDSGIPTPAKPVLAPHLYARYAAPKDTGGPHLEQLLARWRWSS